MTQPDLELRMWKMLKDAANNEPHRAVRIGKLADNHLPIPHKQWTTETVRRWHNMGLVIAQDNGAKALLTENGVRTKVPPHLQ